MLDEFLQSENIRLKDSRPNSEFDSRDDEHPPEIQSHFNRLSNLVNKLRSINDKAPDDSDCHSSLSQDFELLAIAALREAECADFIEKDMESDLTTLCGEIQQKNEALQAREIELARLEETLKAKQSELENRIQAEADQKSAIESCQLRLQETERELNEKNRCILAASAREAEIGKLIERLSSECERLSADLCEKRRIISRLETKTPCSLIKGKGWERFLSLVRMGRVSLEQ